MPVIGEPLSMLSANAVFAATHRVGFGAFGWSSLSIASICELSPHVQAAHKFTGPHPMGIPQAHMLNYRGGW
eukprot:4977824-Amphidinium_carterae.1